MTSGGSRREKKFCFRPGLARGRKQNQQNNQLLIKHRLSEKNVNSHSVDRIYSLKGGSRW